MKQDTTARTARGKAACTPVPGGAEAERPGSLEKDREEMEAREMERCSGDLSEAWGSRLGKSDFTLSAMENLWKYLAGYSF